MKENASHTDRGETISVHELAALTNRLELLDGWLERLDHSECSKGERLRWSIEIKSEMNRLLQLVGQDSAAG
jgi:hypothetical protein